MKAWIKEWFYGLQPRERWILAFGALAFVVIVLWGFILRPLNAEMVRLETAVDMKQRLLLDVARIESLVVKEVLGSGTTTPIVRYVADAKEALDMVQHGGAAVAVLLNPTKVDQVFAVADAGDVMPPKSTYFIPKVPSGLVLRPLS